MHRSRLALVLAACAILAAAMILTQVWFPQRYFHYVADFHLAGVVLVRNLVLILLLAVLALPRVTSAR